MATKAKRKAVRARRPPKEVAPVFPRGQVDTAPETHTAKAAKKAATGRTCYGCGQPQLVGEMVCPGCGRLFQP